MLKSQDASVVVFFAPFQPYSSSAQQRSCIGGGVFLRAQVKVKQKFAGLSEGRILVQKNYEEGTL